MFAILISNSNNNIKNKPEESKKMGDKYIKSGDRLTSKGHRLYRHWAAKSQNVGYIICTWCNSEFLATNATGKKAHEVDST